MSWLRDSKRKFFDNVDKDEETDSNMPAKVETDQPDNKPARKKRHIPAWVVEQTKQRKQEEIIGKLKELEQALHDAKLIEETEQREAQLLQTHSKRNIRGFGTFSANSSSFKKQKTLKHINVSIDDSRNPEDEHFYILKDEDASAGSNLLKGSASDRERLFQEMDPKTRGLLMALEEEEKHHGNADQKEEVPIFGKDQPKIYFTSRTHSQLSQFVQQLRLPHFPPSVPESFTKVLDSESIREISLGSRKQLCIHSKVSQYQSVQKINDECLDLQKKKTADKSGTHGCEFMLNKNNLKDRVRAREFRNTALARIRDIEDLVELGHEKKVCPYYSSREIANNGWAEITTLPYQLLLQSEARDALGLDLKNSIVIIDEAHNLIDTISSIHSLSITHATTLSALKGLVRYHKKFKNKLASINRIWLEKLIVAVKSLNWFMEEASKKPGKETFPGKEIAPSRFFSNNSNADMINIHDLDKFVKRTKLVFKIESYLDAQDKAEMAEHSKDGSEYSRPLVLGKVISFLLAIGNPSWEGKFVYARGRTNETQLLVQYMLLDPSIKFKQIVDECRCVILAGGTMKPVEDYLTYLFPYLEDEPSQIEIFSCDHIIPDKNLTVVPVGSGKITMNRLAQTSVSFKFTFAERNNKQMIIQLGFTLIDILISTPDGVVIFVPSYQYLDSLISIWSSAQAPGNNTGTIMDAFARVKKVFWEPQNATGDIATPSSSANDPLNTTSQVLEAYTKSIAEGRLEASKPQPAAKTYLDMGTGGAVLFAVVGGKMSEGINFNDHLARTVVMIGLPFPHAFSAEMVAKREYISEKERVRAKKMQPDISDRDLEMKVRKKAKDFYENVCMRAVNQCVGRAIRHANDYAAVVLIDERYAQAHIQEKLSQWVRKRIVSEGIDSKGATDVQLRKHLKSFFSKF